VNLQNANGLLTITSVSQPLLEAGHVYWFCDEPAAADSYNGWYQNNQGVLNGFAFERAPWDWSFVPPPGPPCGVFSVSVAPIPEPSILALALFGLGLVARRFQRIAKS
jgi:hypothetical protein